jgi:hypothetical protein
MDNQERTIKKGQSRKDNQEWTIFGKQDMKQNKKQTEKNNTEK